MPKTRLVGEDGQLVLVVFGAAVVGDDLTALSALATADPATDGWYRIVTIADTTPALPVGLAIGDIFWDDGTLVLSAGTATEDSVQPLQETVSSDVSEWSVEASKEEFDVTTLSDTVKVYRYGKTDLNGSLTGVRTIGVNDDAGQLVNKFWRIIKQAVGGTVTVSEIDDAELWVKGVTQKDIDSGETEEFYFMQITLGSYAAGAAVGSRQEFTTNFRIAAGAKPTLYQRSIA